MSLPTLLLIAWAPVALAMVLAWGIQRRTRNAGVVDVLWTFGLGWSALAYLALADGWLPRRLLIGGLLVLWSVRLGVHIARRVASEEEDGRYRALRQDLGERFQGWIFVFFQAQALLVPVLSLAYLVPMGAARAGWRGWDVAAVLLWSVAILGESIADRQLAAWRTRSENRGRTCRAGLWRYSRHPNYFFEWIHWLAYPVAAIGLPLAWLAWVAPALMLFLILRVTGIPPTERRALESRGDDYREYQRTTNAFFPGPSRIHDAMQVSR